MKIVFFIRFQTQGNFKYFLSQYDQYSKANLNLFTEEELLEIGAFFGHNNHKKNHFIYNQNMMHKIVNEFKQRPTFLNIRNQISPISLSSSLIQLILGCNNLRYYDKQFLQPIGQYYVKFINYPMLETSKLIPLLYAVTFLRHTDEQFSQALKKQISNQIESLNHTQLLRLAWMLSQEDQIDFIYQAQILKNLEIQLNSQKFFKYNEISSFNYYQLMYNLFPNDSKVLHHILKKQELQDKFIEISDFIFTQFLNSRNILQEYHDLKRQKSVIGTYIKKSKTFNLSYIDSETQNQRFQSIFEYNFEQALLELNIRYQKEVKLGVYFVDFVINNIVIELTGDIHYIQDIEKKNIHFTLSLKQKEKFFFQKRHLKQLGYSIKYVDFQIWDKLDGSKKQKQEYILNLLQ